MRANKEFAERIDRDDEFANSWIKKVGPPFTDLDTFRKGFGAKGLSEKSVLNQTHFYVNCWHMSDYEPAGLWAAYASESEGVAIKTTMQRLTNSLRQSEAYIYAGCVAYANYDKEIMPEGNGFYSIYTKRREFESEREMRLSTLNHPVSRSEGTEKNQNENNPDIVFQRCNLKDLIAEVRVAPFSEEWIVTAIQKLTENFLPDVPIRPSTIVSPYD